ncbi:hypothetical protein A3F28_00040 [Candidatus Uhrbacteria bacterium RIFCSPHIGHO2_12_FULL_57_11]|uniref:CDP-diacylglycerol--glycerol-3-phosphate 3-phosphatidyltransferase n=1 Tax=Candidatus Uhrbacteria bacterium RIFCSPHIGHO2_12_FULL_57_11 TaxID=1802398 RepID=A0A1F7UKQ6_9BACT|nr:MAG: hypothetical protein A3F28_00040 [Candidatus Uhrbacteria bacterium RIFCSPHIGHO2_12_FULL_57_11]
MRDPAKPYPTDYLLKYTILPLIPRWVRPNHVTVFRFLATPVVVWLIATEQYKIGIIAFLFVALTDAIDGAMARVRGQITPWGTLYDPVADKLLIGSLIFVVVLKHVNPVLGWTIIALEATFIVAGYFRLKKGVVSSANVWGKIKMVMEVAGVTSLLFAVYSGTDLLVDVSSGTFVLAVIFALVSLVTQGI